MNDSNGMAARGGHDICDNTIYSVFGWFSSVRTVASKRENNQIR